MSGEERQLGLFPAGVDVSRCWHEAGHVVVAAACGFRVLGAEVDAHGGLTSFEHGSGKGWRARVAMVLLAGHLAEKAAGFAGWSEGHGGAPDWEQALDVVLPLCLGTGDVVDLSPDFVAAVLDQCENRARACLASRARWRAVGRVAAALAERQRVSADDVHALLA